MSRQEAESTIIVFDEFDKLCGPKIGSGGTNHSLGIQNDLLKLIEGTNVQLKDFDINTSKISFVTEQITCLACNLFGHCIKS